MLSPSQPGEGTSWVLHRGSLEFRRRGKGEWGIEHKLILGAGISL